MTNEFARLLTRFFQNYLAGTRNVSTNTIRSYRDTFKLLLGYMVSQCNIRIEKLSLNMFNRSLIEDFLAYIEEDNGCKISTRNQRLAAIKSFFKFAQIERPDEMLLCQNILHIEFKKAAKPVIQYLYSDQIKLLLAQPDTSTHKGRRDLAILTLLYDSAARVQELCDLKICNVRLDSPPVIRLAGKGRKIREVPLTRKSSEIIRQYIEENHLDRRERKNDPLFMNPQGKQLSRSGVSYILKKYVDQAKLPQITPHCLRHSKAMHMVEAGINLIYIRDFLGHESVETTQIYAKANPEAKRKALAKMDSITNTCALPDWVEDSNIMAFLQSL